MIDKAISDMLVSMLEEKSKILDVGGGRHPWFRATHIIDRREYEERVGAAIFDKEDKEHFSKETWVSHDFYDLPWPFEDKFFDCVVCMDVLEDLRDPFPIIKELQRISKFGYITTPSRAQESASNLDTHPLAKDLYGYAHHRWFVEIINEELVFKFKSDHLYQHPKYKINKNDITFKKLHYFWNDEIKAKEDFIGGNEEIMKDYMDFHDNFYKSIRQPNNKLISNQQFYWFGIDGDSYRKSYSDWVVKNNKAVKINKFKTLAKKIVIYLGLKPVIMKLIKR
ncbi:class I SAM-dependent methyltransferase [Vibrio tritonius]|uniref:class I SAM-dependent methyltransferase n=1 Tax=Vibrio tritonius TaxID=1435069 RepID=UPI00315DE493